MKSSLFVDLPNIHKHATQTVGNDYMQRHTYSVLHCNSWIIALAYNYKVMYIIQAVTTNYDKHITAYAHNVK